MAQNPTRKRNEHGLFIFFDNIKPTLSTASSFEEGERCNNFSFEDIDQTADCCRDIGDNEDFTDVASIWGYPDCDHGEELDCSATKIWK